MEKKYILALDQGTTSSRTIIFDKKSRIISMSQKKFKQIYPKSGWVEHDPIELLESQLFTITDALSKANINPLELKYWDIGVLHHSYYDVFCLIGNGFQCCSHDVIFVGAST